jgi:ATP-grasp ribosomal peptide maturase
LVLVIGEEGDWSADTVATVVAASDTPVFRLTTFDFPQRMALAASLDGSGSGWTGTITTSRDELPLERVTGVYYRRPRTFDLPPGLSGPEERAARTQARVGLGGVLASLPGRWVNHPSALADCEFKPRQLAVGAAAGLRVPATLITNDPGRVSEFADQVGDLVVKPLAEPSVAEAGALTVAYTRRLTSADYQDLAGVQATAHLFQQWVEPRYAVRLTVVGERLFPVAIYPGSPAARVDWRSDYDSLTYEMIACPEPVIQGVRRFMAEFGLVFGAFDFVVEQDTADWFLLECNAGGQWGWLAERCTLPIAEAIRDELTGRQL